MKQSLLGTAVYDRKEEHVHYLLLDVLQNHFQINCRCSNRDLVSAQLQIVSNIACFSPSQFAHEADFPARDGQKLIEIRPDQIL